MFWNVEAVNRSSNCNPGSQPLWFEKSLPVGQRKAYLITAFWRHEAVAIQLVASHGPTPVNGKQLMDNLFAFLRLRKGHRTSPSFENSVEHKSI